MSSRKFTFVVAPSIEGERFVVKMLQVEIVDDREKKRKMGSV